MATILESIGDYLVTNNHGTLGTNLFLGTLPESPDACVAVYENAGSSPTFTMGSGGIRIDYPMLQQVILLKNDWVRSEPIDQIDNVYWHK